MYIYNTQITYAKQCLNCVHCMLTSSVDSDSARRGHVMWCSEEYLVSSYTKRKTKGMVDGWRSLPSDKHLVKNIFSTPVACCDLRLIALCKLRACKIHMKASVTINTDTGYAELKGTKG